MSHNGSSEQGVCTENEEENKPGFLQWSSHRALAVVEASGVIVETRSRANCPTDIDIQISKVPPPCQWPSVTSFKISYCKSSTVLINYLAFLIPMPEVQSDQLIWPRSVTWHWHFILFIYLSC